MRTKFYVLWLVAFLAASALILAPTAHVAHASASGVVISAIYNNGGSAGATYQHRFYELFNAGSSSVSLNGWSLQYASASGTTWGVKIDLPNINLGVGQYFLISGASNGANGTTYVIDNDDLSSTVNSAGAGGKLALFTTTTVYSGSSDPTLSPNFVDFIGYGTANNSEGGSNAPVGSVTLMIVRKNSGCQDTDINGNDFITVTAHVPRSTSSTLHPCVSADLTTGIIESADPIDTNDGVNNSSVDYTVSVSNDGNAAANNTVFTTTLGGTAYPGAISNLTDPSGYCIFATPTLTCTIPSLAALASYSASFKVTPPVATQGTITVDTDATADFPETTGNNAYSESTTVQDPSADVSVVIGYSPIPAYSHNTLNLTFDVANGPQAAANNVLLDVNISGSAFDSIISTPTVGCTITPPDQLDCALGTIAAAGTTQVTAVVGLLNAPGSVQVDAAVSSDAPEIGGNNTDSEPITVLAGCGAPFQNIYDYQEGGVNQAVRNVVVAFEGTVTADFQPASPNGQSGYYIQQVPGDGDPITSDGIFVFNSSFAVNAGDKVRVTGTIVEFDPSPGTVGGLLTELTTVTDTVACGTGLPVMPAPVQLPVASLADWENYEGMLVELTGDGGQLVLSEMFALGSFGEVVVANQRLYQPTTVVEPGAPAVALQALNDRSKILISDGRNGTPPAGTVPHVPTAATMFRMGDTTPNIVGVINYTEFSSTPMHRLEFTVAPTWTNANTRPPAAPVAGGGRLKVASFNVLNFFNGDGLGGGFPTARGANTLSEYIRQRDKLVVALAGLDADIIGLMEIENDGGPTSAIVQLTDALNVYLGTPGQYAFVDTGVIGTDAIRVAILYRPAVVTPDGAFAVDLDPINNRPTVMQTFIEAASGKDLTVVVNHFKSKGSCPGSGLDADQGDGQSCWNATRVLQAQRILTWLPTVTDDTDVLIIGDLNSYANEDPIDALIAAGYTNLISAYHGTSAYGYVFGAQTGYLDHALASSSLVGQVTGADDWHINADESTLRDYNDYANQAIYYSVDEFRTSDHDPVIVGITLVGGDGVVNSTPTVPAGQSVTVTVLDSDLSGASITVEATSTEGESETLTLNATANPGEYSGTFTIENTAPTAANSTLEGEAGTMTFTYVDGIAADGSLNVNRTATTTVIAAGATGAITSTASVLSGGSVTVTVNDADLSGATIAVSVTGTSGDSETLTLAATANPGEYTLTFTVVNDTPTASNTLVEEPAGTLTFTYVDALDEDGNVNANRTDTTAVAAVGADGTVTSTPAVFAGQNVTVTVNDADLDDPTISVAMTSTSGDSETLTLDATANPGEYSKSFLVANDNTPTTGNGIIEEFGGTLTFTYVDALDSGGNVNSNRVDTTTVNPVGSTATITSTETIPSGAQVTVTVVDADIVGPSLTVAATATGESETLQLNSTANPGEYTGVFTVLNTAPTSGNSLLELESGVITFTYTDHLDAEGDVDTPITDTTTVIPAGATGSVTATASIEPGSDAYAISVTDADLVGATVNVAITSAGGESEVIALPLISAGEYGATYDTLDLAPTAANGLIEARDGNTLVFTYVDALDADGDVNTSLTANTSVVATNAPGAFALTSPVDGDILREVAPLLQWSQAAGDNTYEVLLVQLSGNTRLGILIDTVVEADAACAAGTCTIDPTDYIADLSVGTYSWTVVATGTADVEASNAPGIFTVVLDGIELVSNGGFENGFTGWTKKAPAKVLCGAFGAGSDCALQLKAGGSVKQKGVMATILAHVDSAAGDVLRLSALIWSPRSNLTKVMLVKVNYATPTAGVSGNGKDKFKLSPTGVTTTFTEYSAQFALDDTIVGGSVKVSFTPLSGKAVIDDVSVKLMPIGTPLRSTEATGALPLPSGPASFRGGN